MSNSYLNGKFILLVDKHDVWREFSESTLEQSGCHVKVYDTYEELRRVDDALIKKSNLIIIGCAKIASEEFELIRTLHRKKIHLLVLCSFLSWKEMRSVFLAGADDVAEKPFTSPRFIKAVCETFHNIALREKNHLNEYEGVV